MKANDTTLTDLDLISKLGVFDLDPCAFDEWPTAKTLICSPINGLSIEWRGRIWCNPPYSKPSDWLNRMAQHNQGTALVLSSTGTRWFQEYVFGDASALLFMKGRPCFYRSDKTTEVTLMRDSVLVAYGDDDAHSLQASGIEGAYIKL